MAPDIVEDLDPAAWRAGHDSQLEKAVAVAMDSLAKHRPVVVKRPPYPNYHSGNGTAATSSAGHARSHWRAGVRSCQSPGRWSRC